MWDGFNAVILKPLGGRACWICRGVIIYSFNILKKWQLHRLLEIKALNSRPGELSVGYQAVFAVFSLNFFLTTWGTCSPFAKYWLFPTDGTRRFLCRPLKTPWNEHGRNEGNKGLCMIKINCKIFIQAPEEGRRGDEPKSISSRRWQMSFCNKTVELGICGSLKKYIQQRRRGNLIRGNLTDGYFPGDCF